MKKIVITTLALTVVAIGSYWLYLRIQPGVSDPSTASPTADYVVPALAKKYASSAYNFTLSMPADFTVTESQDPNTGNDTIVLQNKASDGIQIVISSFDEDTGSGYTLTAERIHQDLPDLLITDMQPVAVGPNTGLAFRSDNKAFDGASREVWFVLHGNLYQISTYARLDPLLKAIFATWQFN